ncbi:site-2 protease family protein [Fuerstiella marisgermanici]|uniref:site-2 protease family protein n=1 Tax=Fuerstiella marisgermanici TaxID=1891926 RepID=UPI001313E7F2|nr:site-2 protease family protein [Fuerstiella marisgermanici]
MIHELGHTLMALAVRFRVFRIQLGIGDEVFSFQIGETLVSFGRSYGGRVWAAPWTLDGWKWRKAMISIAGPGLCVVVGVVAIVFGLMFENPVKVKAASVLFGMINIGQLRSFIPDDNRPTDGGNLLVALRATPDVVRATAMAAWAEEASQLVERGHPVAVERARRCFDLAPEHPNATLLLAAALMNDGAFVDAKHHFELGLKLFSAADLEINADQKAEGESAIQEAIKECEAELAKAALPQL